MRVAEAGEQDKLLNYLKKNIVDCIYLYVDISNHGISSDHITVWIEEDHQAIQLIVMKYYDSFQIYSHNETSDLKNVLPLLQKYTVPMISAPPWMIKRLAEKCLLYRASYGEIFLMDTYRKIEPAFQIERAKETETEEIARLICKDQDIGGHYEVKNLAMQLTDRIRTGTGRSYIIRKSGEIIAHSAVYAETREIAVVGGTIISPCFRDSDYYFMLSNYMLQELLKEGKTVYTFSSSPQMIRYHRMLHKPCGEYGKLELK